MSEKGAGLGGQFGSDMPNRLPSGIAQIAHIFRGTDNHLPDTPESRILVIELINDERNYIGTDKIGRKWYARINADGKQFWASVMNGVLQNCGLNEEHRSFDSETGLNRNPKKYSNAAAVYSKHKKG